MRSIMLPVVLLALPLVPVAAQQAPVLQAGERVRITAPAAGLDRYVATVDSLNEGVLVASGEAPVRIALREVTRLDLHRGRKSYGGRGALIGLAGGIALGTAAGFAACNASGYRCFEGESDGEEIAVLFGALGGALVGTITGYVIGKQTHGDRWEEVPLNSLRVTLMPGNEGLGVGVGVALRF